MFISKNPEFVYLAFTKCGSSSMYSLLNTHFDKREKRPRHNHRIPPEYSHYPVICVCRNPYARMVSWWSSVIVNCPTDRYKHKRELRNAGLSESFEDFCTLWTKHKNVKGQYDSVHSSNSNVSKLHVVRLENFLEDASNLWIFTNKELKSVPMKNRKRGNSSYQDHLTPKSIQIINDWYSKDFEFFEYDKL